MKELSRTVQLPKTNFSMRANLNQTEGKWLDFWKKNKIFKRLKKSLKDKKKFVLHDGPPYANGDIHLGHALNKILKDIICRVYFKLDFNVDYVPGWDCHGLPIEWKIEEQLRKKKLNKYKNQLKFRDECRKFAKSWIDTQCKQFKRLGIDCDWESNYSTMTKKSESIIVSELLKILMDDRIYLGNKPVMWSVVEKTALAEAEVDYKEKTSKSIFVKFPINSKKNNTFINAKVIIWTTTPWTIPCNRAVAYSEEFNYILINVDSNNTEINLKKNEKIIFEESLLKSFLKNHDSLNYSVIKTFKGDKLEGLVCSHPFANLGYQFDVPLLPGTHLLNDVGSGFVHIAPSHGLDDFDLGKKFDLEIPHLIEDNGVYNEGVPYFSGVHIFKSDNLVIEQLKNNNNLLFSNDFRHSYPHSWRSQAPLIYRATSQWFISMKKKDLRKIALKEINNVNWYPERSKNRIFSMVSERPDWCISRQRSWGVPITLIIDKKTREPLKDKEVNKRIIEKVEEFGIEIWFSEPIESFLGPKYEKLEYIKVTDILDVWFDSGASHVFALKSRGITQKADLYLEGSDQHRGWFQSSLLESCAIYGTSPYKSVLTHGFVLDEKGKKMSKSQGNVISPEDIIKKYGADILRLWVATSNYNEDIRISYETLERQAEVYRKIRNSIRFLLGNLNSWEYDEVIAHEKLPSLERYIRNEIFKIDREIVKSFKDYNFYKIFQIISSFCNNDLSTLFFDIRKDVLYCDAIRSQKRNSVRTVMVDVYLYLIKWLSPVLVFTSEESWQCWRNEIDNKATISCHLNKFDNAPEEWSDKKIETQWDLIKCIKKLVTSLIEGLRDEKKIKSSLEAVAFIFFEKDNLLNLIKDVNLKDILIVSELVFVKNKDSRFFNSPDNSNVWIRIDRFDGVKCERCWKLFNLKTNELHKKICERCEGVIESKIN